MRRILGLVTVVVLAVLVALTLARFVGTSLRGPILLASFSSYALLGFVVVLVGSVLALRGARRRRWVVAAAVVAALGLVVQGFSVAPLFAGGAAGKADMVVMTSNLEFGGGDAVHVVRTVAEEKVEVLALEEVTPESLVALVQAGLTQLLPHRLGTPSPNANGTMVFSRYPLAAPPTFELANGGLDVQVQAPQPFRLLAVHTAQPVGWTEPWVKDMLAIRNRAAEAVEAGPTMVMGDFNATRDHEQLRAVLDTGLRDAAEQAGSGWQPTWPTRYRHGWLRPLVTIDHVLTTKPFEAVRTHTVEIPGTDHRALVAQLRVRKGE